MVPTLRRGVVVEQAARVPNSMIGPANCFATRYDRSRDQSGTMQLGLRFAAAKLPGLRTRSRDQKPCGAKRGLGGQRRRSRPRSSATAKRQVCCRIKKGSAVES